MSNSKQKLQPPPMGGNMFVKFDSHHAVNFGGRTERGKVNDIYIFDLDRKVGGKKCLLRVYLLSVVPWCFLFRNLMVL